MAVTTTITPLPTAPSRTQPSTFSADMDAFLAALAAFVSEVNQVGAEMNTQTDGVHSIWIPASAITPRATSGPGVSVTEMITNKNCYVSLDFDTATAEYAQFCIRMPKSWNEGSITAQFVWSHPTASTNYGVVWALQGVAISNDDAGDVAFGTIQEIADTGGTTNDIYISDTTAAITIGGTPQPEDLVVFQVYRDVAHGSDTMATDARLHGITVKYTTNAPTDN